tara:strand:+ start:497 stop:976 length:480 start_codon:yes stop_codon:yes gene_type:complete
MRPNFHALLDRNSLKLGFALLFPALLTAQPFWIGPLFYPILAFTVLTYSLCALAVYFHALKIGKKSALYFLSYGLVLGMLVGSLFFFLLIFMFDALTSPFSEVFFATISFGVPLGGLYGLLFSFFFWSFIIKDGIVFKISSTVTLLLFGALPIHSLMYA